MCYDGEVMRILNIREATVLFLGDIFIFFVSLWLALGVRYGEVPSSEVLGQHITPFAILFVLWLAVFAIAGLYGKHTLVFKSKLPSLLLNAQIANSLVAVAFFYLLPLWGITPKILLAAYLIISFTLIVLWRVGLAGKWKIRDREQAMLIGAGKEMEELRLEVNANGRYGFEFVSHIDLSVNTDSGNIAQEISVKNISLVVIDRKNEASDSILPKLQDLMVSGVRFVPMDKMYEEVFDRIPLSLIGHHWFLENISSINRSLYTVVRRASDIFVAGLLAIPSLLAFPFVALAIKLEDSGPVFIAQERIGQGNSIIKLWKFRSMRGSDKGKWVTDGDDRITRVGKFIRRTRIDELPQLWNVIRGDISLIGPRPDILGLGRELAGQLPYYTIRTLVKPGLSGWAQVNQDLPPQSLEETRLRLSYDLYYIKHRSLMLDFMIALKTVKVLLSRKGL